MVAVNEFAGGGEDGTVCLWSLSSGDKQGRLALKATLYAYEKPVKLMSIAVCELVLIEFRSFKTVEIRPPYDTWFDIINGLKFMFSNQNLTRRSLSEKSGH